MAVGKVSFRCYDSWYYQIYDIAIEASLAVFLSSLGKKYECTLKQEHLKQVVVVF